MIMDRHTLIDEIRRIGALGDFPGQTLSFLHHPAALDFMLDFMAETSKPLSETLFVFMAAIRYLDNLGRRDIAGISILEEDPARVNLGLFLVRHHDELFRLCKTRHVQSNFPARALPVAELLADRYGQHHLAVIELGCSLGLIGRVLCSPAAVMEGFGDWFDSRQQQPKTWPAVVTYCGLDQTIPEPDWILASIHESAVRQRLESLIENLSAGSDCLVHPGQAETFMDHPAVQALVPRFDKEHPDHLIPVVLTSYVFYQLLPASRDRLADEINRFTAMHGGTWINQEPRKNEEGYRFFVEEDGREVIELENDLCQAWTWTQSSRGN